MKRLVVFVLAFCCAASAPLFAQGVQTGTIRGIVKDQQGLAVPGVTITATSPALQGARTTVTDAEGNYSITALPPGALHAHLHAERIRRRQADRDAAARPHHRAERDHSAGRRQRIGAGHRRAADADRDVDRRRQHQTRRDRGARHAAHARGHRHAVAGRHRELDQLRQMVVNGAMAFDNIFMVNGVDVNDNLFAQPQNLFIEDAIEETQVLTAGISAEYGRFTGGVVNAITKSGGNIFTGSGRVNFVNPDWTTPDAVRGQQRHAGHRPSGPAAGALRGHVRRTDPEGPSLVLQLGPLPEREHAAVAAADRRVGAVAPTRTSASS